MTKNPTTPTASAPETRTTGEGDVPRVLEGGLNEAFRVIANLNQECEAWKASHNALLKEKDLYAKLLDETEAQRDELLAAAKNLLDYIDKNWRSAGNERQVVEITRAAIAKAERKSLIHDPERIEDARIEARLDAIAEREDQIEQESSDE